MFTETNVLRAFGAEQLLDLCMQLYEAPDSLDLGLFDQQIDARLTKPAVEVEAGAHLLEILRAFGRHPGRSMPVVESDGRLVGLVLRKETLQAIYAGIPV